MTSSRYLNYKIIFVLTLFFQITTANAAVNFIYGNSAGSTAWLNKIDISTGAVVAKCNMNKGNGRGIVVVGNVVYYTVVGSNNVYKTNFTTCSDDGVAFTVAGTTSLSAIAYDGTDFWVGSYAGDNKAYKYDSTGTLLSTITLGNCTGNCDGLETFNGKLIGNRGDATTSGYDEYSLTGSLLTPQFISPTSYRATGIAYDGTDLYVSDIFNQKINVYSGTNGAFIKTITITGLDPAGQFLEDLSVDYNKVIPPVNAIPTLNEIGLIILSLLMLMYGFYTTKYRQKL